MDLISDTKQVSGMKDLSHEHVSQEKKKDVIRCIYKHRTAIKVCLQQRTLLQA